jgi:hypothetical protein
MKIKESKDGSGTRLKASKFIAVGDRLRFITVIVVSGGITRLAGREKPSPEAAFGR